MPSLSPLGSRLRQATLALILILGAAILPSRSVAQYMYLDANGDGVNTAEDAVNPTGPTTVDIYLLTDQNRDGSPAICPVDRAFTINSYVVTLRAESGAMSWDSFVNRQSTMTTTLITPRSSSTEFSRGLGGGTVLPPGLYLLATVTVSVLSGTPALGIARNATTYSGFTRTSFGSACEGIDHDNTLKLDSDWFDPDGLCSPLPLTVTGQGKALATRVAPNPLNPSGILSFRTSRDGYVRVRMFDLNGRLVRVLADRPLVTAGEQEIRIDGRGARGETLASGAYFYVVETPEGETRGRIMILK